MIIPRATTAIDLNRLIAIAGKLAPFLGEEEFVAKPSFSRISSTPFARVYKVQCGTKLPPFAVKVCLDPESGEVSSTGAGDYFRSLEHMSSLAASDPVLAFAKPLLLSRNLGAVALEWVDGLTLDTVIRSGGHASRSVFYKLGSWLAHLQNANGIEYRPLDCDHLLDIVDGLHHGHKPGETVSRAVKLLKEAKKLAAETPIPWSISCGDFKPSNVVVTGGRLIALDLDFRHQRPAIHDIAHLLNHVDLTWRIPRFGMDLDEALVSVFLEGYLKDNLIGLPAFQLAWLRLQHAVRLVTLYATWSKPPKSWLTATCVRHLLKRRMIEFEKLLRAQSKKADTDVIISKNSATAISQMLEQRIKELETALVFIVEDEDTWLSRQSFSAAESVLIRASLKPWQFQLPTRGSNDKRP